MYQRTLLSIPEPNTTLMEAYKKADDMTLTERYSYFTRKQFKYSNDNRTKMNIMSIIYKVLSNENSILTSWRSASEWSLIIKLWPNVFENLFEDSSIELIWGDTKNGNLKVDLRLCLKYQEKLHDLSNIEFKKNGNESSLVRSDQAKVLNDAKCILNKKSEIFNLSFEEAAKLKVIVGQVCGLKLAFKEVMLTAPGCYIPYKYGKTIKFPHSAKTAEMFSQGSLEQLFLYKEMMIKQSKTLKTELQKENSDFDSQSTIEDQTFIKQSYIILDKATKWSPIDNDFFKS